jgi:hypothetical protein
MANHYTLAAYDLTIYLNGVGNQLWGVTNISKY